MAFLPSRPLLSYFRLLHPLLLFLLVSSGTPSSGTTRKLNTLVQKQPLVLNYHDGPLLKGNYTINVVMYGSFSSSQRSIILDFLNSLTPSADQHPPPTPSVSSWWKTTDAYKGGSTNFTFGMLFRIYSLSPSEKHLNSTQLLGFIDSRKGDDPMSVYLVLTSADVTVEGFCTSRCGFHVPAIGPNGKPAGNYIWVGNSAKQCPGKCAWPFHRATYGPRTAPLVPPNGDVGIDGMVINIATLLAGAVTNPYGSGYFQGPKDAPLEAVSACTGVFGKGAYPGYPGEVLVDRTTGASYNARGLNGRKYLLPAMWDPKTSRCSTLV